MEKDLFSKYNFEVDKTARFNPRNARLEPFVTRLNNSRIAGGYKPLQAKFYATKMSHIPTDDLDAFYKKLDQSDNFSALWWWYCGGKKSG